MADAHPDALRPGGITPSASPTPQHSSDSQPAAEMPEGQQLPMRGPGPEAMSSNLQQPNAYSGRFPSQLYGPGGTQQPDFNLDIPGGTSSSGPFGDQSMKAFSNMPGPGYAPPAEHSPPLQMAAQPLFAQHSGPNGPAAGPRPTSRQAGGKSQAMNPSVLQPGFQQPVNSGRPSTGGSGATKSPFTPPVTSPPRSRPSQILLINPTSTTALTSAMLTTLRPILPPQLEVVGYTAQYPAPTATETTVDQALSTELVLRDLAKYATNNGETVQNFDALLVASFTAHPLIAALKESYDVPVIGIMEGSLYVSRMLGARFGILATTSRHKIQIDDAVLVSGLQHYFVGCEAVHMSPTEILGSTQQGPMGALPEEVTKRIAHAARQLVMKGADTLIMGSESMSSLEVIRAAKDAIREEDGRRTINVVDCVEAGVMCLNALVGMGVPTSKRGMYRGEREGRRARGQNWL